MDNPTRRLFVASVVPELPKFILAHPCKQLAATLHNQPADHSLAGCLLIDKDIRIFVH